MNLFYQSIIIWQPYSLAVKVIDTNGREFWRLFWREQIELRSFQVESI